MQESLPIPAIVNLFEKSLVLVDGDFHRNPTTEHKDIKNEVVAPKENIEKPTKYWLGENRKKILVIIKNNDNDFLPEHSLAFLSKVLNACQYELADIAIVNQAKTPMTLKEIWLDLRPTYILLFGVTAAEVRLQLDLKPYEPYPLKGISYLLADSLEKMNGDDPETKNLKIRFWNSLKQIFAIK